VCTAHNAHTLYRTLLTPYISFHIKSIKHALNVLKLKLLHFYKKLVVYLVIIWIVRSIRIRGKASEVGGRPFNPRSTSPVFGLTIEIIS